MRDNLLAQTVAAYPIQTGFARNYGEDSEMLNKTVGGWRLAVGSGLKGAALAVPVPVTLKIDLGVRASLMRLC